MHKLQTLAFSGNTRKQVISLLVFGLIYIIVFQPLFNLIGPVVAAIVTVPVVATGWFFGPRAGLIAGIVSIILNAFLFYWVEGIPGLILFANGWPGNLMVLAAGYSIGFLKKELSKQSEIQSGLYSHKRFLAIMSIATKNILLPKKTEEKYYFLANHLANLFVADYAYILSWNIAKDRIGLLSSTKPIEKPFTNFTFSPDHERPDAFLLAGNQTLVIDKEQSSPYVVDLSGITQLSISAESELAIPLSTGEYRFGILVCGFSLARHLSSEELLFAQLAASQIALALWIDEHDAKIKKQLDEANSLRKISQALSQIEWVGSQTILQYIVDAAKELIPKAQQAVIHMLDEEKEMLMLGAISGSRQSFTKPFVFKLGQGIVGHVALTGEILNSPDVTTESRFLHPGETVAYRSLAVAPIKGNEKIFGALSIDSDDINAFDEGDCLLLEAFCIQAAIAIENARLLEKNREDLLEINSLYQVTSGLAATLEYKQLMRDITELLHENFGFYHVQVFVSESPSGDLVMLQASGQNAEQFLAQGYRLTVGEGIVGHVATLGEPFVTNNVENVIFFRRHPLLPNTQSELCVPIKIENKVLGVLDIQEVPPRTLTQRQLKLITAIAEQLAVSLQKASLYEELQNSLKKEKEARAQLIRSEQLAAVGRLLASVSHELNNPIQAIQNSLFLLKSEEQLSEQGRQDLDVILSESERMASLLGRLRDTYRSTNMDDFKNMQPNTAIEEVFNLTSTYMRHKGITFVFHPSPNIPHVYAVEEQINQVVLNILINAIDAMPNGGQITATTDYLPEREQVLIKFIDTGAGVADDILPNIFDAFVTNKNSGSGLGLAISQEIIQRHNGQIYAENNPGKGATFSIWLPANKGPNP